MTSRYDFVGHNLINFENIDNSTHINNIIVKAEKPEFEWVEITTRKIGDWRALFQSTYIGWALTLNGLHVANQRYSSVDWNSDNGFMISSFRPKNGIHEYVPIAVWESHKVAEAHLKPLSMLCSHGLMDLYSCLEEFVFDFFRIYLWQNPQQLLQGSEFKDLRQKYNNRTTEPEIWKNSFSERIDQWQRKKIYNGLGNVFRSYCDLTKITTPSVSKKTTLETWALSIEGFSLLRNCLTHGVKTVPPELSEFCKNKYGIGLGFKEGENISIELKHLMQIESFCDSLLTGLNAALVELVYGKIPDMKGDNT